MPPPPSRTRRLVTPKSNIWDSGCFAAGIGAFLSLWAGGYIAYLIVDPFKPSAPGHVAGAQWAGPLELLFWFGKLVLGGILGAIAGAVLGFLAGLGIGAWLAQRRKAKYARVDLLETKEDEFETDRPEK